MRKRLKKRLAAEIMGDMDRMLDDMRQHPVLPHETQDDIDNDAAFLAATRQEIASNLDSILNLTHKKNKGHINTTQPHRKPGTNSNEKNM